MSNQARAQQAMDAAKTLANYRAAEYKCGAMIARMEQLENNIRRQAKAIMQELGA